MYYTRKRLRKQMGGKWLVGWVVIGMGLWMWGKGGRGLEEGPRWTDGVVLAVPGRGRRRRAGQPRRLSYAQVLALGWAEWAAKRLVVGSVLLGLGAGLHQVRPGQILAVGVGLWMVLGGRASGAEGASEEGLEELQGFRQTVYEEVFTARPDALFELLDALLDLGRVGSLVELSLSPQFRREWESVYAALDHGRIATKKWQALGRAHLPARRRLLVVVDTSTWLLPEAQTLPDRGVHPVATTLATATKLGVGYAYSTIGVVPEAQGSWFLPLGQQRVSTESDELTVGAEQIQELAGRLEQRGVAMLDSKYGNGQFLDRVAPLAEPLRPNAREWRVAKAGECPMDLLIRLAGNRKFYGRPPAYPGSGRPRVHGAVFRFLQPTTWRKADEEEVVWDARWGRVRIRAWHQMHAEDYPEREVTVVLVERGKASGSRRQPKRVWLMWYGIDRPSLEALWRWYERRFTIEHWHRFSKQTLNWTRPHLGTEERMGRWGEVVILATWQLWLARAIPGGAVQRWQKRRKKAEERTPGQVRQSFRAWWGRLGTPAQAPQRRGRSRGRQVGQCPGRKPRYEVVKKGREKPRGQKKRPGFRAATV